MPLCHHAVALQDVEDLAWSQSRALLDQLLIHVGFHVGDITDWVHGSVEHGTGAVVASDVWLAVSTNDYFVDAVVVAEGFVEQCYGTLLAIALVDCDGSQLYFGTVGTVFIAQQEVGGFNGIDNSLNVGLYLYGVSPDVG